MTQPEFNAPFPGVCLPVKIHKVHDGDTCTVSRIGSNIKAPIRLIDVWAPETSLRGNAKRYDKEKRDRILKAGKEACIAFQEIVNAASTFHYVLPFSLLDKMTITEFFTFGRVLGHLYADGKHVGQMLIGKGVAFATKAELEQAGLA